MLQLVAQDKCLPTYPIDKVKRKSVELKVVKVKVFFSLDPLLYTYPGSGGSPQ